MMEKGIFLNFQNFCWYINDGQRRSFHQAEFPEKPEFSKAEKGYFLIHRVFFTQSILCHVADILAPIL